MAALAAGVVGRALMAKAGQTVIDKATEKKAPSMPAPKAPPVIPDEEAIKRERRRAAALRFGAAGSGRQSTMLTGSQGLGG